MAAEIMHGGGITFAHLETYSARPSALTEGKPESRFVLLEAARHPGAVGHLMQRGYSPRPPIMIRGLAPDALLPAYEERLSQARVIAGAGRTRRQRSDTATLLGEVHSYPAPGAEWSRPDAREWIEAVAQHRERDIRSRGGDVLAVYAHEDERYAHLHVLAVSTDPGMRANLLHPGFRASEEAAAAGQGEGARRAAFQKAMRGWQDMIHADIGARFGLLRRGPGIRRQRTYADYQTAQRTAVAEANASRRAQEEIRRAEEMTAQLQAGQLAIEQAAQLQAAERQRMREGTLRLLRLLANDPLAAQTQAQVLLALVSGLPAQARHESPEHRST